LKNIFEKQRLIIIRIEKIIIQKRVFYWEKKSISRG
jgi:hypothetical protein